MPDSLKSILVDDWEKVTKDQKLVPIPAPTTITQFLLASLDITLPSINFTSRSSSMKMYVYRNQDLPPDPTFPVDLKGLG